MKYYKIKLEKIISELKTNIPNGLSNKEAKKRLQKYGPNIIPEKKPLNAFFIFLKQFLSPLMFILLIASALSFLIGEIKDTIIILIAVAINIILGFIQEFKAEKAAQALKSFEVPFCNVRRNEKIISIPAKNLVPGDIVLVSAGSKIPADIRLTHIIDFQVEEALLTGESKPIKKSVKEIEKDVTVGDRINMAFSGTNVLSGKAEGIVTDTGSNSYLGQIAELIIVTKEKPTPLQQQIKRLSWWLGLIFVIISFIIFALGLIKGIPFYEIIIIAIALAVAAIPEGLLVGVTVILAIGMQRMLKRNALIKHLIAAETLGSVSVICTDKTGTLTQGHMLVSRIVTKNHDVSLDQIDQKDEVIETLKSCTLNNDAQIQDSKKSIGHPTEIALLKAAQKAKINIKKLRKNFERLDEIPFSSDLKYMATIHKFNGLERLIVKGAPEKIFDMCIGNEKIKRFKHYAELMAKEGLRLLAVAMKDSYKINFKNDLYGLEFLGLIGIEDPLRPQAKQTVKELKGAGIYIALVTGDHKDTASKIAQKSGIEHTEKNIMTGTELDEISDNELVNKINKINIFARVDPRHKIRIVHAWQKRGHSVAMTGDGINDAPSLKAADIGISLGAGSDVTHEISDMVLLDNNLLTIDAAVKEGRTIFDNIRKVIVYLLADSFSEILLVSGSIFFGLPLPILASQILWINLVTDGFPYMALTFEPSEPNIMKEKPRRKDENVINKQMKILIFIIGIITDIGLFGVYYILLKFNFDLQHIRTIIFTALAIDSLFYIFSIRSMKTSIFKMNPFSNIWLIPAVVTGFLIQLSAIYIPTMQKLFSTTFLSFFEWNIIIILALVKIISIEISKRWFIHKKFYK
ncbi:HAD-IC family P-type ATPase [Candidatus Babeliales bacterium]|nr:HAD-IC family P-type ATPase [Candidatus Babeliales bacterium]